MKGKHINVSPDGKIATGAGVYGGYTILSDAPLMKKGLNRFWVSILHTGIRVGVAPIDFDIKKLVGDDRSSWSVASNGKIFYDGEPQNYTTELISGDVIEVILEWKFSWLRFLINNREYGFAFENPRLSELVLYPAVSLLPGAQVKFED